MEQLNAFVNDPLVAPLLGVLVLGLADMALGVYQSIRQHAFDLAKLPGILDSTVLRKVVPLATLGIAGYFMADGPTRQALLIAYGGFSLSVLAAQAKAITDKVGGEYVATTLAQDRAGIVPAKGPDAMK